MAKGIPGADSSIPVTPDLVNTASGVLGQTPKYWGRYFKSKAAPGNVEYRHKSENPVLAASGIRLLPVARQTNHVGGTEDQGRLDAVNNVEDFLATFDQDLLVAQGGQFLMFLDVEGLPEEGNPSLSVDYYRGWAPTLMAHSRELTGNAVTISPCVYARQLDNNTWNALITANNQGIGCGGAWVARYPFKTCDLPEFADRFAIPANLDDDLPFDVLIWQYAEKCAKGTIDCNQTNPNIADIDTVLFGKLVLPPGA
jgi:hypothetical protein